jgi:hypothetical protein
MGFINSCNIVVELCIYLQVSVHKRVQEGEWS